MEEISEFFKQFVTCHTNLLERERDRNIRYCSGFWTFTLRLRIPILFAFYFEICSNHIATFGIEELNQQLTRWVSPPHQAERASLVEKKLRVRYWKLCEKGTRLTGWVNWNDDDVIIVTIITIAVVVVVIIITTICIAVERSAEFFCSFLNSIGRSPKNLRVVGFQAGTLNRNDVCDDDDEFWSGGDGYGDDDRAGGGSNLVNHALLVNRERF